MDQMKALAKDLFIDAYGGDELLEELKASDDLFEKLMRLDEELGRVNMSKANLSEYPTDRQNRFLYVVQSMGVDLGLCPYYRSFHSRRNHKIHQICEGTRDKLRTACLGNIKKCTHGYFNPKGELIVEPEGKVKKREWTKI